MPLNVVHIISRFDAINFGLWNSAIFASEYLHRVHSINSFLWSCRAPDQTSGFKLSIPLLYTDKGFSRKRLSAFAEEHGWTPGNTIFVTHGCWGNQTRIGYALKRMGFRWIYVPHGMLEPWSLQHRKWKKVIYLALIEKRLAQHADVIRAVGMEEKKNLVRLFDKEIFVIENGVVIPPAVSKSREETIFLFMARLHHKKGVLPLVRAWSSAMEGIRSVKLIIAGPDEGELEKIMPYVGSTIEYVGAVYDEEKQALLQRAHYYALPSYSEGFPTSVVEAMSFGAIPLISTGCNFPAVFRENLGYNLEPDEASIAVVLNELKEKVFDEELSLRNRKYIEVNNSEESIGEKLVGVMLVIRH